MMKCAKLCHVNVNVDIAEFYICTLNHDQPCINKYVLTSFALVDPTIWGRIPEYSWRILAPLVERGQWMWPCRKSFMTHIQTSHGRPVAGFITVFQLILFGLFVPIPSYPFFLKFTYICHGYRNMTFLPSEPSIFHCPIAGGKGFDSLKFDPSTCSKRVSRTVVKYNVELQRATFYYGTLILFPTILITYLSFGVFFMSHEVGESGHGLAGTKSTWAVGFGALQHCLVYSLGLRRKNMRKPWDMERQTNVTAVAICLWLETSRNLFLMLCHVEIVIINPPPPPLLSNKPK